MGLVDNQRYYFKILSHVIELNAQSLCTPIECTNEIGMNGILTGMLVPRKQEQWKAMNWFEDIGEIKKPFSKRRRVYKVSS
jgi:hypothetical protein